MAKHEVSIHENTSATQSVAPYLGSYVSKETVRTAGFVSFLAAKCGLPAIQVQTILSTAFEVIEDLERESLTRIALDGFTVCGVIKGTFPTSDAPFDPGRNSLELALRLDDSIRLALADATPVILADDIGTKLRVDNVMDLEYERPMNLVHGKHVFRVAGFNMVLSDEGAEAYLENSLGAKFPLTVDEVISKQLFKAHTGTLLEGGDYKLWVKSRAGVADGPLQTSFRKVKYLRVEDPAPTRATLQDLWTSEEDGPGEMSVDDGIHLVFDVADPEGRTGYLVVDGVQQPAPVVVDSPRTMVMWTFGGDELIGQSVNFKFRYEDGTEVGDITKTIRARR